MTVVVAVDGPEEFTNEVLRMRALNGHCNRSLEFSALVDGQEAGFLSYEDWSETRLGFIYELYVLPSFRGQGVGRDLIQHGESHALRLGCTLVQLKPYALDQETSLKELLDWYRSLGYKAVKKPAGHLQKRIGFFEGN